MMMLKKSWVAALLLAASGFSIAVAQTMAPAGGGGMAAPAAVAPATRRAPQIADQPAPRMRGAAPDTGWMRRHETLTALAKKGDIDLYFVGDSITDFWQTPSPRGGRAVWAKEFGGWKPGDFGISADMTQHVLYRLENGELDGVKPKAFVVMIGTNNLPPNAGYTVEQAASGVKAIVDLLKEKEPQAKILLLAIFPRNATADDPLRKRVNETNEIIAKLDDGKQVKFLNINDKFLDAQGTLSRDIMPDLLHPNAKGYQIWADAIKPQLTEWLGAPPATQPQ